MAATDPQTLYALANCYHCAGAIGQANLLKLALLAQAIHVLNPMTATDPASLLALTNCHNCGSNASIGDQLFMGLLILLNQNISSNLNVTIGAVLSGHYAGLKPAAAPPNPAQAAINYDLDAPFREWKWDGSNWT